MPRQMSTEELFGKSSSTKPRKTMSTEELFGSDMDEPRGRMDYGTSGLYGAAQGATFGFADEGVAGLKAVYDKFMKDKSFKDAYRTRLLEERENLKRAQENPKSYMAGLMGGGVATGFIPGLGWANIGKAGTLGRQALQAGALGGLAGAGASESGVDDLGGLAKDVLTGATVGAATQGVLGKGSQMLKRAPAVAADKAAERAVKAATGQNIKGLRNIAKTTHASAGDVDKALRNIQRAGKDILEETTESGKPLLGAFDDVETLAPKLAEARKSYGAKIGDVGKAVDTFYPSGAVQGSSIADKLRNFAEQIPPVDQGNKLIERINKIADDFDQAGNLTFEKANLFKNQFKYKADDADLLVSNKDVTNKIRSIIGGEMDDTAANLSQMLAKVPEPKIRPVTHSASGSVQPELASKMRPEQISPENFARVQEVKGLLDQYGNLKGKYGSFKALADAASDRVQKNLSNRFVSPSDYGVGSTVGLGSAMATGDPAMLLVGALGAGANKLARERGSAMGATALRKISELAQSPAFQNKYARQFMEVIDQGPAAMLAVHSALMSQDSDYAAMFGKERY